MLRQRSALCAQHTGRPELRVGATGGSGVGQGHRPHQWHTPQAFGLSRGPYRGRSLHTRPRGRAPSMRNGGTRASLFYSVIFWAWAAPGAGAVEKRCEHGRQTCVSGLYLACAPDDDLRTCRQCRPFLSLETSAPPNCPRPPACRVINTRTPRFPAPSPEPSNDVVEVRPRPGPASPSSFTGSPSGKSRPYTGT